MAKKEVKHNTGAEVLRVLTYPLAKMPLSWHYFFSRGIDWIMRKLLAYRRDVILTNLAKSFPDKSYSWIKNTARDYYRHLAEMIVEFIWFGGCRGNESRMRDARIVEVSNPELLKEVYEKSPSTIILNTHCGNWELIGGMPYCNYGNVDAPMKNELANVVYKPLKSKLWDDFFKSNRTALSPDESVAIPSTGLLRFIVSHRKEKHIYVITNDQYPREASCEVGTFLHQPTTGFVGAATLANKFSMGVLYMSMINDRTGHYTITFRRICDDASTMSPEEITRKYYDLLEQDIIETPHNWLWSHKRWKNIK